MEEKKKLRLGLEQQQREKFLIRKDNTYFSSVANYSVFNHHKQLFSMFIVQTTNRQKMCSLLHVNQEIKCRFCMIITVSILLLSII